MADSRMIRAGILTSEAVNSLSWGAEVFYRRLMSVVDDFGLYDGRVGVLRGSLYPLQLHKVADRDVDKWLDECSTAGLVTKYTSGGKPYIKFEKFGQRLRVCKTKYPHPPDNAPRCAADGGDAPRCAADGGDAPRCAADGGDAPRCAAYSDSDSDSDSDFDSDSDSPNPTPAARAVGERVKRPEPSGFVEFWTLYPSGGRKRSREKCLGIWRKKKLEPMAGEIVAGLKRWKLSEDWAKDGGKYIPATAVFLNDGRWDAHPAPKDPNPSDADDWVDLPEDEIQARLDSLPPDENERGAA